MVRALKLVWSLKLVSLLVVIASATAAVVFWRSSRAAIKAGPSAPWVAGFVAVSLVCASAVLFREKKEKPAFALLTLIALIWLLVVSFAALYYANGSTNDQNFLCASHECQLSRWGAIYFSVGTLTTAGTGALSAIRHARPIQGIQMILGIAVVLFAATAVVSRFVSARAPIARVRVLGGRPGGCRDWRGPTL